MTALITPAALQIAREAGHDLVVIDVRWALGGPPGREDYDRGHIPGAVYVDLDTDLAGPPGTGGRHPLPDPEVPIAALRRAGVSQGTAVVVYDDGPSLVAARAWWVFRHVGLDDVRVLDGGYAAWLAAGLPTSTDEPHPEEGDVSPHGHGMPTVSASVILTDPDGMTLIDVRAPERYRGEVEPVDPVAGHIPGAVNHPTTHNVDDDGRFLDDGALRAAFATVITDDRPVAVYCGSGVTAAHTILALHEIGVPAALYPGSWSGWITDPSRPVATGG